MKPPVADAFEGSEEELVTEFMKDLESWREN
jgi:hypothetical protein